MHSKTKTIVLSALMAALACVATMIIKIPSPMKGYLNLGDCVVLAAGWLLPGGYAFFAAALGSALADLFSGYIIYAPATFIIKGVMGLIAFVCLKLKTGGMNKLISQLIGGVLAEITMVAGYFIFEGFLYGFGASVVNVLPNAMQGLAGIIFGILLIKVLEKANLFGTQE